MPSFSLDSFNALVSVNKFFYNIAKAPLAQQVRISIQVFNRPVDIAKYKLNDVLPALENIVLILLNYQAGNATAKKEKLDNLFFNLIQRLLTNADRENTTENIEMMKRLYALGEKLNLDWVFLTQQREEKFSKLAQQAIQNGNFQLVGCLYNICGSKWETEEYKESAYDLVFQEYFKRNIPLEDMTINIASIFPVTDLIMQLIINKKREDLARFSCIDNTIKQQVLDSLEKLRRHIAKLARQGKIEKLNVMRHYLMQILTASTLVEELNCIN